MIIPIRFPADSLAWAVTVHRASIDPCQSTPAEDIMPTLQIMFASLTLLLAGEPLACSLVFCSDSPLLLSLRFLERSLSSHKEHPWTNDWHSLSSFSRCLQHKGCPSGTFLATAWVTVADQGSVYLLLPLKLSATTDAIDHEIHFLKGWSYRIITEL